MSHWSPLMTETKWICSKPPSGLQNPPANFVEELFPAHGFEFREEQRLEGDSPAILAHGALNTSQSYHLPGFRPQSWDGTVPVVALQEKPIDTVALRNLSLGLKLGWAMLGPRVVTHEICWVTSWRHQMTIPTFSTKIPTNYVAQLICFFCNLV